MLLGQSGNPGSLGRALKAPMAQTTPPSKCLCALCVETREGSFEDKRQNPTLASSGRTGNSLAGVTTSMAGILKDLRIVGVLTPKLSRWNKCPQMKVQARTPCPALGPAEASPIHTEPLLVNGGGRRGSLGPSIFGCLLSLLKDG